MSTEKWDTRLLALAEHVSSWSKDKRKKVGAVVTEGNYIRGIGYNGFPRGIEDSKARLADQGIKLALVLHAETNALTAAQGRGDTIYVTHMPCTNCLGHIIQAGIKVVVTRERDYSKSKWNASLVLDLADEAGIEIIMM